MTATLTFDAPSSAKASWDTATNAARLFYNYLRFSPSYAAGLIHRVRGSLKRVNRRGLKVLACVNKYADVYMSNFEQWIKGPGANRLAACSFMPEIQSTSTLKVGDPSDLFIRFPQGKNAMPQLELLAMIAATVPSISKLKASPRLTPVVQKNLWRDVYLTYLIKNYPETELWRLGAEAMLVDRFIGRIEPTGRRMNASQDYERRLLVSTVIRHREWALNVSEHAAEDRFPCKDPLSTQQLCLDMPAVNLTAHLAWHAEKESHYARQQVLSLTKAKGRVSATPYLKDQGVLF